MKLIKILVAAFCILMAVTGIGVTFAAIDDTAVFVISLGMVALFALAAFALLRSVITPKRKTDADAAPAASTPEVRVVRRDGGKMNIAIPAQGEGQDVELPFARVEFHHSDPDENVPSPSGAELSYLDAKALRFWNKKHTDYVIPDYYKDTAFGRNVGPALDRLLEEGYIDFGGIDKNIALKTIPEIKAVLAEKGLKLSGNKAELIKRLIDNVDPYELEALFPVGVYVITPKGEAALEPYSIIEANDQLALRIPYYRLMNERASHPEETDEETLRRILLDDVQSRLQAGDKSGYQDAVLTLGRFLREIGKPDQAFDYYSLSFFMWALDARKLGIDDNPQSYYQSKFIDECGKLCGYSLNQAIDKMQATITGANPFGLATGYNVKYAIKLLRKSLGLN